MHAKNIKIKQQQEAPLEVKKGSGFPAGASTALSLFLRGSIKGCKS
jgi:hypothetical protein